MPQEDEVTQPRLLVGFLIVLPIISGCAPQPALKEADASSARGEWPSYNRSPSSQRFSPLKEINVGNAGRLREICTFDLGEQTMFESGPIMVNGIMYVTSTANTYAFDPSTCKLVWKNHSELDSSNAGLGNNRGAAYADGKIFRGLNAGYLIALDAKTGKLLWKTKASDGAIGESLPAAPVVWNGLVYLGNAGGDNAGVRGRLMAFDANDGHLVWSFDLVPMSGPGSETWPPSDPKVPRSGGATWSSYTIDEARGLILAGTGNAAPDFDRDKRPGKNLYTNSIVILDAKTGKYHSSYQVTPNDFHDWDAATAPVLLTTAQGKELVLEAGKDGLLHAIDLKTMKELYATVVTTRENVDVPISTTGTHFCPGTTGSSVWNGPSYSPDLNLVFVNSVDLCTTMRLNPDETEVVIGRPYSGAIPSEPFGKPDPESEWKGWVTAVDADSGVVRWRHQMKAPVPGAITSTAGGLVFSGDTTGNFLAFSAADGKVLFQTTVSEPIGGGIVSYLMHQKQFVAVAAGLYSPHNWGAHGTSGKVIVFGL